eukprot:4910588-Amphidinium_carterae.1
MEPEALAPYGYEVTSSSGVRDKLDKSANLVATNRALSMSDREIGGIAVSVMFVFAAGYAPARAAASQEMEVVTCMDSSQTNEGDVVWSMLDIVSAADEAADARSEYADYQRWSNAPDREIDTTRVREVDEDIYIYQYGRRFHTMWNCRAVTGARSQPQRYTRFAVRRRSALL